MTTTKKQTEFEKLKNASKVVSPKAVSYPSEFQVLAPVSKLDAENALELAAEWGDTMVARDKKGDSAVPDYTYRDGWRDGYNEALRQVREALA